MAEEVADPLAKFALNAVETREEMLKDFQERTGLSPLPLRERMVQMEITVIKLLSKLSPFSLIKKIPGAERLFPSDILKKVERTEQKEKGEGPAGTEGDKESTINPAGAGESGRESTANPAGAGEK